MSESDYNYARFVMRREQPAFAAFRRHLNVGEQAPGGLLERLDDGAPVELDSHWRTGAAIFEFGSFT